MNNSIHHSLICILIILTASLTACTKEVIEPTTPLTNVTDECVCGKIYGFYYSCTVNWIVVENECSAVRDTFYLDETPSPILPLFSAYCSTTEW